MTEEKLLPCPLCNGKAGIKFGIKEYENASDLYRPMCTACGLSLPWHWDYKKVANDWNTRA